MTYRELEARLSCLEAALAQAAPETQGGFRVFAHAVLEALLEANNQIAYWRQQAECKLPSYPVWWTRSLN